MGGAEISEDDLELDEEDMDSEMVEAVREVLTREQKELGRKLDMAMDLCGQYEKKIEMTGRETGATSREFGDYVLETIRADDLESRWQDAVDRDTFSGS